MSVKMPPMRSPWIIVVLLFLAATTLWKLGSQDSSPVISVDIETPKTSSSSSASSSTKAYSRPLITYVYAESDSARVNLQFFLDHGLHDQADFVFIFNTPTDLKEKVPKASHIKIVERDNSCFDLGSHAEVLKKDDLYKNYKRFILMNASIRGPFLPYWSRDCWTDLYLSRVTETNKLVGMTSNCWPQFHIQSMIWATDIVGLELLLQPNGIAQCFDGWQSAVNAEVGATSLILKAGYSAIPLMTWFHSDEEHFIENCDTSHNGDVLWDGKYEGTNVHAYETIFMKANRDVDQVNMDRLTEWHDKMKYSSYEVCGRGV